MAKSKSDKSGKNSLNIYWKIKNFSYVLENIRSPIITISEKECYIEVNPKDAEIKIVPSCTGIHYSPLPRISFVPCDGSKEVKKTGMGFQPSKDLIFGPRKSAFLPEDTLTVCCRFFNPLQKGQILIRSQIGINRKCVLWTLKNFSKGKSYKKLKVENSCQYGDIRLNLKSSDETIPDEEFYIEISKLGGDRCYCSLKISVLDAYGKAHNYMQDEFVFGKEDEQQFWKFSPVINKTQLLDCKKLLLPNDTLSLKCDFVVTLGIISEETTIISYHKDVMSLLKSSGDISKCFKEGIFSESNTDLVSDLEIILDNGTVSDVSLEVGSDAIKVHKHILSDKSSVFDDIFMKCSENEIYNIVIMDLDAGTLRRLLIYMYTDAIHDYKWENIFVLYIAAVKYDVSSLKGKCSTYLKANIDLSNVCEVLVLADLHQDTDLISAVQGFISENSSEIFASKAWKELEKNNSTLALQTLREICSNK